MKKAGELRQPGPGRNNIKLRFAAAGLIAVLTAGCAGQTASYGARTAESVKPQLYTITPEYIAELAQKETAASREPTGTLSEASRSDSPYRYLIGPADVLQISVPTIVSFNAGNSPGMLGDQGQQYTVYDDGTIYVPFSGPVKVAGLTLREAQLQIVDALAKYLRSPQVIVSITEYRSQRVMVTGQLQKPGYQPITDVPLTLIGALSGAGAIGTVRGQRDPRPIGNNLQQSAIPVEMPDLGRILLKREGERYEVNVDRALRAGDLSQDILLRDGDVVVVSAERRTGVVVMGEVLRPALYEISLDDTNLAQLLMAAGGLNQLTANASRVYVIRGDFRQPSIFQLDASSPDALLLAQKFPIEAKDVIFVAEAPIARWNRALQQILPTVQGLLSTAIVVNTVDSLNNNDN